MFPVDPAYSTTLHTYTMIIHCCIDRLTMTQICCIALYTYSQINDSPVDLHPTENHLSLPKLLSCIQLITNYIYIYLLFFESLHLLMDIESPMNSL